MANYYFPLESTSDVISEYNGTGLAIPQTAQEFADDKVFAWIENDTPSSYPDLCVTAGPVAPTAVINSIQVTAEIIAGSHPPQRPK